MKISLAFIEPLIWRRLLVDSAGTLDDLHAIIQMSMPWSNSHLHQFEDRDGNYYSDPMAGMEDVRNELATRIDDVLKESEDKIIYTYDMGDSWEHLIVLEKILPLDEAGELPRCVDGKRSAPPDDCGGPWGYGDFLAAIADPEHDNHKDMIEWVGGEFDPEFFDCEVVTAHLRKVFKKAKPRAKKKKPE